MDEVIELAGNYSVVVAIGGIGALLGACSLWLRYREARALWARRLCLFSDILNTAFVSITVVGVLTVSFELAIHLPNLARSQDIPEKVDLGDLTAGQSDIKTKIETLGDTIPAEVDISDLATRGEIRRIIQDVDRGRNLHSRIVDLHAAQALNENSLAVAVHRALGYMEEYHTLNLGGDLSDTQWSCVKEGTSFLCAIENQ